MKKLFRKKKPMNTTDTDAGVEPVVPTGTDKKEMLDAYNKGTSPAAIAEKHGVEPAVVLATIEESQTKKG